MTRTWLRAGALLALLATPLAARAKIVSSVVEIPVEVVDIQGRTVAHRMKTTILRDDARAKSPFLILGHGRAARREQRAATGVAPYLPNAEYFVAKGFAVLVPLRVGYGETGGPDVEFSGECDAKNYPPAYEAGVAQTLRAIAHAKTLPFADPGNRLVVGQSFGGTIAIAIAAKAVPGVKGALNFAGGAGGRPDTHPEQPCQPEKILDLFRSYGPTARIPTAWFYSENDKYWGPELPRQWHKAFVDAGGVGRFVRLPPYKTNGHPIFTGDPDAWKPAFEAFLASCCQTANAAPAAPNPETEAFTTALAAWAAKHKVAQAVVVVRRNGRVVHKAGIGGADPDAGHHLASLSKAITGACVATLVRDGRLGFDTKLSKALEKFFRANGRPADGRIETATIGQLLTHRAGFAGSGDGEDPATRSVLVSYLKTHSPRVPADRTYLSAVLAAGLHRDPGAAFAYSNAGYLALGAVIEEATGQTYEDHCRRAVLTPAGAYGRLDPGWGVMSSYGGWRLAGADYLAFFDRFDPAAEAYGPAAKRWMLDRTDKSEGGADNPTWYGPGIRLRNAEGGVEFRHTGSWRREFPADARGKLSIDTSTLAVRVADGTSWFVHSTPLVLGGARVELDRELLLAYRSVKNWSK